MNPEPGLAPVLVLALDGATFHVIEPMIAAGRLPNLAAWMSEGTRSPLPSTQPPVTFPAWSSFMTGLEPGEHGIFDFTQKRPGDYRIRFVNATDRAGTSFQRAVSDAGGRVLVLGLPATFPPEPLEGLLVPGFDAPVSTGSDAASTSNPRLYAQIADAVGPWMRPDLDESAKADDFHERAIGTLLARIERKEAFAIEALARMRAQDGERPELALVVFAESDTVGHHYWRDHDPASPRHDPAASAERRDAIAAVYARLDAACGRIREAYGQDALCVVVSDHGMGGAARHVVHLNRFLAERGLLARAHAGARRVDLAARWLRDLALRVLPAGLAQILFRRARFAAARLESAARFGGIDWSRTIAFSEEANTQPGVWINLTGREARGAVAAHDYERVRDEVIATLLDWKLPAGGPVLRSARRREQVYAGPFLERAPDIVVELAHEEGYGLSLVPTPWDRGEGEASEGRKAGREAGRAGERGANGRSSVRTLEPHEYAGGRGRGMNGTHRDDGIFIATAGDARREEARRLAPSRLSEVTPALATWMGLDWPGRKRVDAPPEQRDYTPAEDGMVAERLRALGYMD